ncbi:hypothetical protein ACLB1M_14020 [Escherichia coli]
MQEQKTSATVLVVQDPFTSYYDAQVVADFSVWSKIQVSSLCYCHFRQMAKPAY